MNGSYIPVLFYHNNPYSTQLFHIDVSGQPYEIPAIKVWMNWKKISVIKKNKVRNVFDWWQFAFNLLFLFMTKTLYYHPLTLAVQHRTPTKVWGHETGSDKREIRIMGGRIIKVLLYVGHIIWMMEGKRRCIYI